MQDNVPDAIKQNYESNNSEATRSSVPVCVNMCITGIFVFPNLTYHSYMRIFPDDMTPGYIPCNSFYCSDSCSWLTCFFFLAATFIHTIIHQHPRGLCWCLWGSTYNFNAMNIIDSGCYGDSPESCAGTEDDVGLRIALHLSMVVTVYLKNSRLYKYSKMKDG